MHAIGLLRHLTIKLCDLHVRQYDVNEENRNKEEEEEEQDGNNQDEEGEDDDDGDDDDEDSLTKVYVLARFGICHHMNN